jgi:ribosomal protein S13
MNEETIKMMAKLLGVEEKDLYKSAGYEFMMKVTMEITALVLYLKRYEVMTPESIERFEKAVKDYLTETNLIMSAEADIEQLRQSE